MNLQKIHVRRLSTQRATTQFVELDGLRVGLRFQYSKLQDRWYMWLFDTDSTIYAGPFLAVPGIDLFRTLAYDPRIPGGQLFVRGDPPNATNVDLTAELLYRPAAQVTA